MNYPYLIKIMDWCWFICFIPVQCETCHIIEQNYNTISVQIQYITNGTNFTYNKPGYYEAWYHVGDTCEISCEQTAKKYTLSWTQQTDNVSISYPPNMAKKSTIKITLDRFDNETVLRCAAFEDGGLKKTVSDIKISFKLVNSQIESINDINPLNLEVNPECSKASQGQQYVIIDEKLHLDSLMYPNDTTKICIHNDFNETNDDIFIKRRVTYMNNPKLKIQLKPTTVTPTPESKQFSKKSAETGKLWMAIGGGIAGLTILLVIIVIWKKKRKSSPDITSDPIYATAQDMNRVVYAELDMDGGSSFTPNGEEITPYAQVVGIIKKKNRTRRLK